MTKACGICLENYTQQQIDANEIEEHQNANGSHGFHKSCGKTWANIKTTCPFRCGADMTSLLPLHQRVTSSLVTSRSFETLAYATPMIAMNALAESRIGSGGGILPGSIAALLILVVPNPAPRNNILPSAVIASSVVGAVTLLNGGSRRFAGMLAAASAILVYLRAHRNS